MGATAAPPQQKTRRPDRARRRGYRNRPALPAMPAVPPTPVPGWVREGLPPVYFAALLLRVRRERIDAEVINPQTGEPYKTAFDIREYKTLLAEQALLCRLALGGRHGGTIVTTSFQLYKTLAEAHPSWQLPADENDARELLARRIRDRLYMLDACGLLAYWQDGHTDEYDVTWLGRRTILELKELPALSDDELQAGASELKARQRRYGRSLNTDSTIAVRNVFVASRPLPRAEIKRRGITHAKAAKTARAATARDHAPTLVVEADITDTPHPFGTPPTAEDTTPNEKPISYVEGFTYAHTRVCARPTDNPKRTAKAAGDEDRGLRGVVDHSRTRSESPQEPPEGPYSPRDDLQGTANRTSPYMRSLLRWSAGNQTAPIPHPGHPSPADLEDPEWQRDRAAYLAVALQHPDRTRDAIRHRQRVGELTDLAERVRSQPLTAQTSWTELQYCWAVIRHRQFAYGEERRYALQQAGILTAADRRKLDQATELYDRHAHNRPDGWPATGIQALWHIASLAHDERLPAFRPTFQPPACRWLRDGIARLKQEARDMAALTKCQDPERPTRQRRRAERRLKRNLTATPGMLKLDYRTPRNATTSLADTLVNYRGEVLASYGPQRDHALMQPTQNTRSPLSAELDGAQTRRLRRAGAADPEDLPAWQRHPFEAIQQTVTVNANTPWQRTISCWRADPVGVDRARIELAHLLGPGTLPQLLGRSDQAIEHMLHQLKALRADAQHSTSGYRLNYGPCPDDGEDGQAARTRC